MRKTIYIDTDEEITAIIEKIKIEPASELFLVVPKDAMLLQGVVNLKLLKKEADKLNKKIVLVTSDKYAKKVIQHLGIATKEKTSEDFSSPEKVNPQKNIHEDPAEKEILSEISSTPKRSIGSSSFYEQESSGGREDETAKKRKIPVSEKNEDYKKNHQQHYENPARKYRKLNVRGGFVADKRDEETQTADKTFRAKQ
ncbi:MAG: hypothetical protein R6V40_02125, partial [Candidatus Moraniibacteriota bacterium]